MKIQLQGKEFDVLDDPGVGLFIQTAGLRPNTELTDEVQWVDIAVRFVAAAIGQPLDWVHGCGVKETLDAFLAIDKRWTESARKSRAVADPQSAASGDSPTS